MACLIWVGIYCLYGKLFYFAEVVSLHKTTYQDKSLQSQLQKKNLLCSYVKGEEMELKGICSETWAGLWWDPVKSPWEHRRCSWLWCLSTAHLLGTPEAS